jgi:hypothetical protein
MMTKIKVDRNSILKAVEGAMIPGVKKATVFQHPELTVVACHHGKPDNRSRHTELLLAIGKPNYHNRQFVKACLKAGEKFPVRRVQLEWFGKPERARK